MKTLATKRGVYFALWVALTLLMVPNVFATPQPDTIFVGTATFDGVPLNRNDTGYTIVGKVYDPTKTTLYYTASYTMGSLATDNYTLSIKMDSDPAITNKGHLLDVVVVTINGKPIVGGDLTLTAYGAVPNTHISAFSHGAATKFIIIDPTDGTADAAVPVTIELQDTDGNKVLADSSSKVTVHVSGTATIDGATSKQVTMTGGQATVSVLDSKAETVNLTLSDSAGTGYNVSSTQNLVIGAGPLATLTVSPNTATVAAGRTQQFTVAGVDANGNTANMGIITWSGGAGIGTINATGLFTATTVSTGTVTATSSLGKSDSSGTITVVTFSATPQYPALVTSGTPHTTDITAIGATNYTWSKVSGNGILSPTTGATVTFTAPTSITEGAAGHPTVIRVTDADNPAVIFDLTIKTYEPVQITQPPGYVDGEPSTYPLLTLGRTTTLTAADDARTYQWSIKDWNGNPVEANEAGATTFILPDTLFAAAAGIYTVALTDANNPGLAAATLNVRVPMKFLATKFTYKTPADTSDTYTVTGGPDGSVYNYAAYDLNGVLVVADAVGAFQDASPTDNNNVFAFAENIEGLKSYRVKVSLDPASGDADVQRLIAAGLGEVWSGIFRIVPVVDLAGTVVEVDEVTPIAGATVTATFDPTLTDTTGADGSFTIPNLELTGATFSFVVSAPGYVDKTISGTEIPDDVLIVLEQLGAGGTITGLVTLSDDPAPYASGTVQVKAKSTLGSYVKDGEGTDITVLVNATSGAYTFPIPAGFTALGPFDLEFRKSGYIVDEASGLGVLTGVALAAANADITLYPVTIISITATRQDTTLPADGTFDQVLVEITAEAGLGWAAFDGTDGEIKVLNSAGTDVTVTYGANKYSFINPAYENFTITVYADVSEDRDVDEGYKATTTYTYVKSAAQGETVITNPSTTGGTAVSPSGDNEVTIPPGGLTGEVLGSVTLVIVEVDAGEAGATRITGSEIIDVTLVDENGNEVNNANIARVEITLKFNPREVRSDTLKNGTFVIFQANTVADLIAGNATPVPTSQIILPIDYTNGFVTFWVNHLSAFGIGAAPAAQGGGGGGGGGGCFVASVTDKTSPVSLVIGLLMLFLVAGAYALLRRAV